MGGATLNKFLFLLAPYESRILSLISAPDFFFGFHWSFPEHFLFGVDLVEN